MLGVMKWLNIPAVDYQNVLPRVLLATEWWRFADYRCNILGNSIFFLWMYLQWNKPYPGIKCTLSFSNKITDERKCLFLTQLQVVKKWFFLCLFDKQLWAYPLKNKKKLRLNFKDILSAHILPWPDEMWHCLILLSILDRSTARN